MRPARDKNEPEIIAALERFGYHVIRIHDASPPGAPDLIASKGGKVFLIEVKSDRGRFSSSQERMFEIHPIYVLRSVEDVIVLLDEPRRY